MMSALNVIYEQEDQRTLIRSTGLSIALIIGAIVIGILGVLAASVLGYVRDLIHGVSPVMEMIIRISTWVVAFGITNATIAAMYRFAPDRHDAKWRWLSVGAVVATLLWLAVTLGFGVYAANFGGYDVTYGSLSAIVVLLMWLYLSAYAILLGALINAEAERQTSVDTTTGPPLPIGARGATMADMTVAARD
jgi:membrane protein